MQYTAYTAIDPAVTNVDTGVAALCCTVCSESGGVDGAHCAQCGRPRCEESTVIEKRIDLTNHLRIASQHRDRFGF